MYFDIPENIYLPQQFCNPPPNKYQISNVWWVAEMFKKDLSLDFFKYN